MCRRTASRSRRYAHVYRGQSGESGAESIHLHDLCTKVWCAYHLVGNTNRMVCKLGDFIYGVPDREVEKESGMIEDIK